MQANEARHIQRQPLRSLPDNGPNARKVVWHPLGTIATGVSSDGTGTRFANLNGFGRAEYIDLKGISGSMTCDLTTVETQSPQA